MRPENARLLYENPLKSAEDVKDFILEGEAGISFVQGRLRLENTVSAEEGQKANYVLWCPESFPADIYASWQFWPIREPGLAMVFFSANGKDGKDLFDPSLEKRTGEYTSYHHGDINAFHASYFRRKEPEERAFQTCNLRKSYGFHLVTQGGDPIPSVQDAQAPYTIAVKKQAKRVEFFVNDMPVFLFEDDGKTYGPLLGGGYMGFRQLAPLIAEYADLRVWAI